MKDKFYYIDGVSDTFDLKRILHRTDGPAVEMTKGGKQWFLEGKRHRENGPAIEYSTGDKEWYLHGKLHREDGPAIEYDNGNNSWWLHGKLINCDSQEMFERLLKLKVFW